MSTTVRVEFVGASGDNIVGRLERPVGPMRACALFAHCFTCSKDLKAVVRISRALAERDIGVLRFDFTGLGESGGEFAATDFSSNVGDLLAAAELMRAELGGAQLLIGHSLGGAAVLSAASRIAEVEAVVTLGAPSDTRHLSDSLLEASPGLAETEAVEIELGGRPVMIGRALVEDLARYDLGRDIAALGRPLLILHSPVDETVDIDHAARIYQAARHPKSFVSLDGADHLLLRCDEDSRFVAEIIACWSSRYLGGKRGAGRAEGPRPSSGGDISGSPEHSKRE
ncbi:MAG: alpha/beta hydrolase [Acidobacteria bacterium]|nr:alpha/beta hydrolase [Acidobacteriota bacterium]